MAVLAADRNLGVRRRTRGVDGYGTPTAGTLGPLTAPKPGRIVSHPDIDGDLETGPGTWVLALDPGLWPIGYGDQVVEGGQQRTWTVTRASLRASQFDSAIDYVRVEASEDGPADG
ncbi:hypothetical protein [Planomonospora sp. ID82291]|uniref:hypothetical protein n=1 Tax=Planomonospora sp. ID82291 TaxID=2738136 RepID=UPI0018C433BA|nr:hypothetical protein [Planomonospora sp. ID82291]MBG0818745.1 hypothetical protein [Planomonospora sp. ID82291]